MLLHRLRHETRSLHDQLERHPRLAPLTTDALSREAYGELLERLLGFYEPLEARLATQEAPVALADRWKTPLLVRDLHALGRSPAALPRCAALPEVCSAEHVLGCLYVLEGATLGGAVIRRHLARNLGVTPEAGGAFYASYGANVGPMWKAFCAGVEAYEVGRWRPAMRRQDRAPTDARAADAVVGAARATFVALDDWLRV